MQHDSHEFLMHLIGTLQDEETPKSSKRFNGEVSKQEKRG
jgi:ubiquitin C-terminal hydrolase